jgi:membrane associated rhomboid family serine protease
MATCYRHPNRETGVACSNCGRPICTDCMTPTPVGMRCPECAKDRTRVVRGPSRPASEPTATIVLIALNVIAFIAELGTGSTMGSGGSGSVVVDGGLFGPYVADGEWYRLLTSGFLHSGLMHIAFNMFFIWVLGSMLEPALGRARFVALYFTALLSGSLGVMLLDPTSLTVGASGAAFGLLGAAIVEARARGLDIWASGLGLTAVLNFGITFLIPGISIGGHLGGFVGGMVVALLFQQADRMRLPRLASLGACAVLAVLVAVGAVAAADSATTLF